MFNRTTNSLEFSESAFVYFPKPIENIDFNQLKVEISKQDNFDVLLAYSYDNRSFSTFIPVDRRSNQLTGQIYLCLWFRKRVNDDLKRPLSMWELNSDDSRYWDYPKKMQNVNDIESQCICNSISYNSEPICLSELQFRQNFDVIDEFPRWNIYDKQQVNIQRWLETCNAQAEMYGHTVIYFKTEPIEHEEANLQSGIHGTHFTLANNVVRNVTDVKKLHIMFPNNEVPQDRVVFSEWDIGMQDEVVIHVVRQKFEQAFGYKAIPNEKDFIYIPLVNKLFRVSTKQAKNGFMGVVGWYEVFLSKYEEDDTVRKESILVNSELNNSISDVFGLDSSMFGFEPFEYENPIPEDVQQQLEQTIDDGLTFDDMTNRIEEEKAVTDNLSNRLIDTTWHVSLKETEALREFYDSRLDIVSVNPERALFPITMYNCSNVEKRQIALRYNLQSYTVTNQRTLTIKKQGKIAFDFVLMSRFNGTIFELGSDNHIAIQVSIQNRKLKVFDTSTQVLMQFETQFDMKELYQVVVEYVVIDEPIYSIKLFKLSDDRQDKSTQKQLLDQDIYNLKELASYKPTTFEKTITNINLFGGSFLIGNINYVVDNNQILQDGCLPLINKNLL